MKDDDDDHEDFACFDTDYSLIMLNNKGIITGYIDISLYCNKLNSTPVIPELEFFISDNFRKIGFSNSGRKKLIKLLGLFNNKLYPSQR